MECSYKDSTGVHGNHENWKYPYSMEILFSCNVTIKSPMFNVSR